MVRMSAARRPPTHRRRGEEKPHNRDARRGPRPGRKKKPDRQTPIRLQELRVEVYAPRDFGPRHGPGAPIGNTGTSIENSPVVSSST